MPHLTVPQSPDVAKPGLLYDAHHGLDAIETGIVDNAAGIEPGLVVMRTENGDEMAGFPTSIAADVDAIKTNIGSTAGVQTFSGGDFNGAIGAGRIFPPATIDLVLDSHVDWDATTAVLTGLDENGLPISEDLTIPNGGNATVTSTKYFSYVEGLSIPAQSGTGGTATLGVSADRTLDGGDVLGVSVHTHKTLALAPSSSNNEVYEDESELPLLRDGRIWVEVENAFRAGDCVLVRLVATGSEKVGAVRVQDTDGGDCVAWRQARLRNSGSAGGFGILEVNL